MVFIPLLLSEIPQFNWVLTRKVAGGIYHEDILIF